MFRTKYKNNFSYFKGLSDEDNVPAKKKQKPEQGSVRVCISILI